MMKVSMKFGGSKTNIIFTIFLAFMPIGIFCYLLWFDINPSGTKTVFVEMGERSAFAEYPLPAERLSELQYDGKDASIRLLGDPIYFNVHTPKTLYEKVTVEILFRNHNQPLVEFGPLVDIFSEGFDLRPLDIPLLDDLSWHRVEENGTVLFERDKKHETLSDFFDDLPSREKIATYHYAFEAPFRFAKSHEVLVPERSLNVSLRGHHRFITYIRSDSLSVEFLVSDVNRDIGEDIVEVRLRDEAGNLVSVARLEDDGNTSTNQETSMRSLVLQEADLPEGVYTIEMVGTSDTFWRSITTRQKYLTFINTLSLGDSVGYRDEVEPVTVFTNAKDLTLQTSHVEGLQTIVAGEEKIAIEKTHEKISAHLSGKGIVEMHIPSPDLRMAGDGLFAFEESAFFSPNPLTLTSQMDFEERGIDYILASYQKPHEENGWQVAKATFDLQGITDENGNIRFAFSLPSAKSIPGKVDVHAVKLTFEKPPLTRKQFLQALRERLPFNL